MVPRCIKAIAISFLLTTGAVSCLPKDLIDCHGEFIYNPDSFPAEQQAWIEESSLRWNTWVGHRVTSVRPGHSIDCFIDVGEAEKETAIGQTTMPQGKILIDVDDLKELKILNRDRFEGVVMHEMGHAIGYPHIETGPALMAPSGALDFTELDRIACVNHKMCSTL